MTAATTTRPVITTDLKLPTLLRGKVRDVYRLPASRLLFVASDRVSAFDVVMPTPIPGKGAMLTGLSTFWFRFVERLGLCRTHLLSTNADDLPADALTHATTREDLRGRITIGTHCQTVPIECVVRGYLAGSGFKEYAASGSVCGIPLPPGLANGSKLPEPIFTPATKAEQGLHDENISFERAAARVGRDLMARLRHLSISIYNAAARHALDRGIIIADTKFEFGLPLRPDGSADPADPILIDEALTPDSSRFWPADQHRPGHEQPSFDKQFLREHLERLVAQGLWNKAAPGPELPPDVVAGTADRYAQACQRLMA